MHSSYLIALATQGLLASALPYMLNDLNPFNLLRRDDPTAKTSVYLGTQNITWGNVDPEKTLRDVLGKICTQGFDGCNNADTSARTVQTQFYQADGQTVVDGTLTFSAYATWATSDTAQNWIDCVAGSLGAATTKTSHKVIVIEGTSTVEGQPPATTQYVDSFYSNSNVVKCHRESGGTEAVIGDMQIEIVATKQSESSDASFCSIGALASTIAGLFSGPLGAFFGIGALVCSDVATMPSSKE